MFKSAEVRGQRIPLLPAHLENERNGIDLYVADGIKCRYTAAGEHSSAQPTSAERRGNEEKVRERVTLHCTMVATAAPLMRGEQYNVHSLSPMVNVTYGK